MEVNKVNVNTTPNVATPSFQARLKNNDVTTKVVNKMNTAQMAEFKEALTNLSKVSPDDVVEISKEKKSSSRGFGPYDVNNYSIKNSKDKGKGYVFKSTTGKLEPQDLINVIKKVVNPKTKVGKTVLPDNNTNVQPAAEAKQKAKQEILDMMA